VIPSLTQWVYVRIADGKTITEIHPSNEELVEQSKTQDPPAERVWRLMYFFDGFPAEYRWVVRDIPGISLGRDQVMSVAQWLAATEREARKGDGHVGPAEAESPKKGKSGDEKSEVIE